MVDINSHNLWLYFGCGDRAGHYLWPEGRSGTAGYGRPLFEYLTQFDGRLAPFPERKLFHAAISRLGAIHYSALSWWDNTVDKRPGSNSTIFAPSMTIAAFDIVAEGEKRFSWVFKRLPQKLVFGEQP